MALQNGVNSAVWQGSTPPPNPSNGNIWVEKTNSGPYWETWYWDTDTWYSGWHYWTIHYNGSAAFQSTFIVSPVIPNSELKIDQWTVNALTTSAPTTATQWTFTLNALSQSNAATVIKTLDNSGAVANSQKRKDTGSWDSGIWRRSSTDKILRVNATPGSTAVSIVFTSTLRYQIVRP